MFGVELEETLESLEDACAQDPNNFEFALEYMRKLYIAKDFSKCAEVAEAWNRRYRETPALMFLGAAMIGQAAMTGGEKGGELAQKGYEFVLEYMKTAMNKWTTEFAAIALVSRGICHEGFQDKEKAEKAYREALELDPECAPALESMADLTGKPAESFRVDPGAKWVGQPFPLEYQLPWHPKLKDGAPAQNFRAALQPGGYLGIILLGSYRGCGPCNVETRNVALLAKQFRDKITAVHLITANEERERENWNDAERWFRSSGLNFHVLFDAEDKVAQAVGLTGAPTLVFVDAQGTIVSFSNELKEDLYWRLAQ
jgi:tetratricopeptide (TPR) repeat protein